LALGSGGARGYAHIGVLKALKEENLKIDLITGSSIGALIGVLYSHYESVGKVEEVLLESYWREVAGMVRPSKSGMISAKKVQEFLREFIGDVKLEDLDLPVGVIATDFHSSESVLIRKGSAIEAVQASIAFPLFIEPLKLNGKTLWDGGLSSQVPTEAARKMGATRVIGVNLNETLEKTPPYEEMNSYGIGRKAITTLQYHMTRMSMEGADIKISPNLDPTKLLGFETLVKKDEGKEIIKKGYEKAKEVIKDIKK